MCQPFGCVPVRRTQRTEERLDALDNLAHLLVLALHTLEELVLSVCTHEIVLRISGLVVLVTVDVVHKEAEYLLESDVSCRECKPVKLALNHRCLLLVEVTLCISLEHLHTHLYVVKVLVVLPRYCTSPLKTDN